MSELPSAEAIAVAPRGGYKPKSPFSKAAMMWTRRLHLYFGLSLFPWAVLYGVTAFLFNHPLAFSDAKTWTYYRSQLMGTPLENAPSAEATAVQAFAAIAKRKPPGAAWKLANPQDAVWVREFAFANANGADGKQLSLLYDMRNGGGTIRETKTKPPSEEIAAPFAVGNRPPDGPRAGMGAAPAVETVEKLEMPEAFSERLQTAAPVLFARLGLHASEVVVTSVPGLRFGVEVDGELWEAIYDPMTGGVSGKRPDARAKNELSIRQFLLRLHTTHGYPSTWNARWFWAVVVDCMAFVMVFWGVSGLLMWWQIKATRTAGWWTLLASAAAATALVVGMHRMLVG